MPELFALISWCMMKRHQITLVLAVEAVKLTA